MVLWGRVIYKYNQIYMQNNKKFMQIIIIFVAKHLYVPT